MTKTDNVTPGPVRNDWAGQASSMMIWWGLPLAGVMSVSLLHLSFHASAALVSGAFTWMAIGCLLNALRCHRVHCYISGPVFLAGAIVAGLAAAGVTAVDPRTFGFAVNATMVLALLSFAPELVWKRYA